MKRKPLLLFAFPGLILAILAGERMAAFLLGAYPASPTVWWIWLELRPLSTMLLAAGRRLSGWLDGLRRRRPRRRIDRLLDGVPDPKVGLSSSTNHVALLFAGLMIAVGSHSETASTIAAFTSPGGFLLAGDGFHLEEQPCAAPGHRGLCVLPYRLPRRSAGAVRSPDHPHHGPAARSLTNLASTAIPGKV